MGPQWVMGPPWSPKNLPTGSLLPSGVGTWEHPRFLWASWCGRPPSMESPPGPTSHGTMAQHHLPVLDRRYINLHELELLSVYVCFCFLFVTIFLIVQSPPIGVSPIFEDKQKHRMAPFTMFNEDPPKVHDLGLGHRASQCCLIRVEQLLLYYSMDLFNTLRTKSTGKNTCFIGKPWFPVDFPCFARCPPSHRPSGPPTRLGQCTQAR
jgi:hypothetical protein